MEEQKDLLNEGASAGYDAADRLFDFMGGEAGLTALVCEADPTVREKISEGLKGLDYQITTPEKAKEALKAMRFHVFDVVVLNELFDTTNPETNEILLYLDNLNMSTRRRFFVALVSDRYRTMDNMAAFSRSVNLVINLKSIEDTGRIIKQGLIDHKAFYHIFQETLQKLGKA
jgi:CheY-like chemotaxis protein